jgi:homocysteine S-methyltransferase
MSALADILGGGEEVIIADGGLATELEDQGHDLSDDLWSARLLLDAPEAIVAAHLAYFRAGAAIATTASYQVSAEGFAGRGAARGGVAMMLRRSVALARQARAQLAGDGARRWVAASVGPYGAMLAGGQEYTGRYGLSVSELRDWHRPRAEILAGAGADLLAIETLPDTDEAEALASVVSGLDVPCWMSYTIAGDRTRAGQPLADAFAIAAGVTQVVAVGVNCCAPADVPAAVALARQVTGKPVIAYPNSGQSWDGPRRQWTGASQPAGRLAGQAAAWVAAGARIVGGCCRVTPADIAAISRAVAAGRLRVPHPQVGLGVAAAVTLGVYLNQVERSRHDVPARLREGHAGPLLPFGDGPRHHHGPRRGADDHRAETLVGTDPGIDVAAVRARPPGEAVHGGQRVPALEHRPDRRDDPLQPRLQCPGPQFGDHLRGQARSLPVGAHGSRHDAQRVRRDRPRVLADRAGQGAVISRGQASGRPAPP